MGKVRKTKLKQTKKKVSPIVDKRVSRGKSAMSDTQRRHAVMADAAYNSNKKAIRKVRKSLGKEWEIDRELSTRRRKVFYNPNTKESVYSARGTKPTDRKDLKSDAAIVASRFKKNAFRKTGRMKNERKRFDQFDRKYSDYSRQGTGHSLGGAVIAELTRGRSDVETTAFARGTFSNQGRYGSNLTDVANRRDLISNRVFKQKGEQKKLMLHKNKKSYNWNRLGAHDMSQFL